MNVVQRTKPALTPEFLGYDPVPTEMFSTPEFFELEREYVFRRSWICVGREEEVGQPGDFMVREVESCNSSALITRDKDGVLRAFHNICTHRGNSLVTEARGNAPRFSCGYHAWTFSNDGELRGVTDQQMFFDLDRKKCGLRPIHLDVWRGFIFLNFAKEPEQTLRESLGGMADKLDGVPFEKYSSYVSIEGTYDGNWKVAIDAFQESYHLGYVHNISFGPNFSTGANPSGRMISTEFFGPHHAGSIWGNRETKLRPVEATAFAAAAAMVAGNKQEGLVQPNTLPPTINPTGDPDWGVEMNLIYPTMFIFLNAQGLLVHLIQPISHGRTRWEFRLYSEPVSNARALFALQLQLSLSRDSFSEDAIIIEAIHKNLQSGALSHFQYQDNEVFPRHLYHTVREAVRSGMVADGRVPPDYIA